VGVPCQPKEELTKVPTLLAKLRDQANPKRVAQPLRPELPKLTVLEAVEAQTGNAQLLELFTRCDEITTLSKTWGKTAEDIAKRLPAWHRLERPIAARQGTWPLRRPQSGGRCHPSAQRSLLSEPRPGAPPAGQKRWTLLRQAVQAKREALEQTYHQQLAQLQSDADWCKLTEGLRSELIAKHNLSSTGSVASGHARPTARCAWTIATLTTGCPKHRPCPAGSRLRDMQPCSS
jgi:hypothetical protein